MACEDFVSKGPWKIVGTWGARVGLFVPGNTVTITEPAEGEYTVSVADGTSRASSYPNFTCVGDQLDGVADGNALQMSLSQGAERRLLLGAWNPLQNTSGQWVGDEGGGGGRDDV